MSQSCASLTTISVIVPCRNEREHVLEFIDSLLAQELPADYALEVLIADGMSSDGTRAILEEACRRNANLKVIDNPAGYVSAGLNKAILAATGEIIVRMDVHTVYARDYILRCIETLQRTGADNVGGPLRSRAKGYVQQAIRLGLYSPFASGGARSRDVAYEGPVDTVVYGCWRKSTLERLGLFDEELVRNQDDELNLRITRAGGTVWQSPQIQYWYYPRAALRLLFAQYQQYGYWKVRVIQKHRLPASVRHVVPGGFVLALIALSILSPFWVPGRWMLGGLISLYAAMTVAASVYACTGRSTLRYLPIMPLVFAAYQFGYGIGFVRGVIDFVVLRRGASKGLTTLTRGSNSA